MDQPAEKGDQIWKKQNVLKPFLMWKLFHLKFLKLQICLIFKAL